MCTLIMLCKHPLRSGDLTEPSSNICSDKRSLPPEHFSILKRKSVRQFDKLSDT